MVSQTKIDDKEPGLAQRAMAGINPAYLSGLNKDQLEAVQTIDGPVLMLAGAGTGKTRALTARIANLIHTRKAKPYEILAVTFTNKAAREMKNRLGLYLGSTVEGIKWLGTFHSLCVKLLRRHAAIIGLESNFTIIDSDDQLRLMRQLIKALNIDEKKWPVRSLASQIDNWKNRAILPNNVPDSELFSYNGQGQKLYKLYQERLITLNAADFGDLLMHVVKIFKDNPDILVKYQHDFKYILVDEYQDTNIAQYLWLRLLAKDHKNICCVGDDDQSIYGWRGAEVGNILKFENDFGGARVIRLEKNYRSTHHILNVASSLISANQSRLGKTLYTDLVDGEQVRLVGHWDGDEEARWIGEEIEAYERGTRGLDPVSLNQQAILVRTSFQMRAFEDRFISIGLNYKIIGGPRFYERQEIRDAIAYFRIVINPEDNLAMERIINTPKRGLGEKALQTINVIARNENINLIESAKIIIEQKLLKGRALNELQVLVEQITNWKSISKNKEVKHTELAEIILDESGYTQMWMNENSPTAPGRLENLKELIKALEDFENIQGFLEHIALVMENEQEKNTPQVSIMTLHAAKGLEFTAVFLPGWEDGLFPSQRTLDENGQKGLEEERRLAYVGITRAEQHCVISFVANRRIYNQWQSSIPSRFIDNLSVESVEVLVPPSLSTSNFISRRSYVEEADTGTENMQAEKKHYEGFRTKAKKDYITPGLSRMRSRKGELMNSKGKPSSLISIETFNNNERVFHQKFGYGYVTEVDEDNLVVCFDKAGTKKVKAGYLFSKDQLP